MRSAARNLRGLLVAPMPCVLRRRMQATTAWNLMVRAPGVHPTDETSRRGWTLRTQALELLHEVDYRARTRYAKYPDRVDDRLLPGIIRREPKPRKRRRRLGFHHR